jgi:hypothetical protein
MFACLGATVLQVLTVEPREALMMLRVDRLQTELPS